MRKNTISVYRILNGAILALLAVVCILPLLYVISASMMSSREMLLNPLTLVPREPDFTAYRYILSSETLIRSLGISIVITLGGTVINMVMTVLMAYPLSRKTLRGRGLIQAAIVFTMLFSGGMIPTYLVVSGLGLTNTLWAVWLPGAISAFNLLLLRNFFSSLPEELIEAARIDGAGEARILAVVVVPLSLPSIAAFSLFYAVAHWNSFFSAILYLNESSLWPIQVWLRQIALMSSGGFADVSSVSDLGYIPPQSIVYAVIVVATLPVLVIYPFVQRYFVKGGMVGAVKG